MGRAWLPTTEQYNGRALNNVPLLLPLFNGRQETLLSIFSPVLDWWICVVEGMHTTMKVTLREKWEGGREEGKGKEGKRKGRKGEEERETGSG